MVSNAEIAAEAKYHKDVVRFNEVKHHGVCTLAIGGPMTLRNVGISTGIPKYIGKHFPLGGALCLVGTCGNVLVHTYPSVSDPTHPVRVPGLSALGNSRTDVSSCRYHGWTAVW